MYNPGMTTCECGCGQDFEPRASRGGEKRFVPGHHRRTEGFKEANRARRAGLRIVPPADYPTDGLCRCGCGSKTPIAKQTSLRRGHYNGYPTPYLQGHGRTGKRGPGTPGFKGRINWVGYVLVYAPDHPAAYKTPRSRAGYIPEHRKVWEEANGRRLGSHEHVHHINGVKDDNRPENLVALSRAEHRRVHNETRPGEIGKETREKLSEATRRAWAEGRMRKKA